jgi:2-keto-4-pentenoate hydratase/2-oxohepta-3-ene-1,7-dioic acid hydratase in catechol pathway
VTRFVRFQSGAKAAYGILEGDEVREIEGGLFNGRRELRRHRLADVKLLFPCEPGTIFAIGLNYRSHLGARKAPEHPEIFYKPVSSLQNPGDPIVIPRDAVNVHSEGELVIVIGRRARQVSPDDARAAIFGVTCGNDVSEREWQRGENKDLQWWRAKGSDTFAPLGPVIVEGADYGNLLLTTRVNGQVAQQQRTSDLIFDPAVLVSWISGWVTLNPGDVIYTGTPGSTSRMHAGDIVEVELEGIGTLRNPVTALPA